MEEILKMIEEVDPSDTAKLNEIDARVWCFINQKKYYGQMQKASLVDRKCFAYGNDAGPTHWCVVGERALNVWFADLYTRSRDALKAIRPEGYAVKVESSLFKNECFAWLLSEDMNTVFRAINMPTEELAELSTILQAINYERTKK